MRFHPTKLKDAYIVELEPIEDGRGTFARSFCSREFREHGLADSFVQCNLSWNRLKGTLRGLHFQRPPSAEVKLVRCTSGALWDVIVDLRQDSPTYLEHIGVELSAKNRLSLYIPELFAHGFQTLEESTEVLYQMSAYYAPDLAAGLPYNDPKLRIPWPLDISVVSEKDRSWTSLR